jgi:hypothetical protein
MPQGTKKVGSFLIHSGPAAVSLMTASPWLIAFRTKSVIDAAERPRSDADSMKQSLSRPVFGLFPDFIL